jgi:replication-associated recombination protein RarA
MAAIVNFSHAAKAVAGHSQEMDTDADPYSPKTIEDMAGGAAWTRLQTLLTRPDPPHVVLVGPAGIGKSCAIRLCLRTCALWLRCSADPTLRDNRERIKAVARRRATEGNTNWIVLEHADALHADAQAFLRRIIETSMGATRFVLEVRDAAAIAEPLLSRTVLFNAPQLLEYEIRAEVQRRAPGSRVDSAAECDGNVRWAVLQGLASLEEGQEQEQEQGFLGLPKEKPTTWVDVLRIMETIQTTGSSPRAYSDQNSSVWDRPGGICPWALLGLELSASVQT